MDTAAKFQIEGTVDQFSFTVTRAPWLDEVAGNGLRRTQLVEAMTGAVQDAFNLWLQRKDGS